MYFLHKWYEEGGIPKLFGVDLLIQRLVLLLVCSSISIGNFSL